MTPAAPPHANDPAMPADAVIPGSTTLPPAHDLPHEGPIRTPRQLVWAVLASFLIPIIAIILLVNYVDLGIRPAAGSDALQDKAVAQRLQRIGSVEIRDPSGPQVLRAGLEVFNGQCAACHVSGAAGAPKVGDAAAWAPRIKTGFEALWNSTLKGKGAMGAQGGGEYSDAEIARAVVYLANQGGAKFDEPKAPAAASAPADAAVPAVAGTAAAASEPMAGAPGAAAAGGVMNAGSGTAPTGAGAGNAAAGTTAAAAGTAAGAAASAPK